MTCRLKKLMLYCCMLCILGGFNFASANTTSELEGIFNWAENNFPMLFPNHKIAQIIGPWKFRFYPETGIYVGEKENEIFVLGGPWGENSPVLIDTVPNLLNQIATSEGSASIPGCASAVLPSGMVVTQNNNVVHITTNGQCIKFPAELDKNFVK